MEKKLPDNFCIMPWINASVDVNGSVRPCCKFVQPTTPGAHVLGNLKDQSIKQIWSGAGFDQLRKEFLSNGRPSGCQTCWAEEAAGIESYRISFTKAKNIVDLSQLDPDSLNFAYPLTLDLKSSNKCNLKCRICGPIASSSFLDEDLKNQTGFQISEQEKAFLSSEKFFNSEENTEWIVETLMQCKHIEMTGGEPMLSLENRKIEQLAIELKRSQRITLLYNTNVTLFSPAVVQSWASFKAVTVCLSIDDIFERFEYQRYPAKWSAIEKNISLYKSQIPENTKLIFFCSVSILNVFYLPEILTWFTSNHPKINCYLNIVHNDPWFCVANADARFKDRLVIRLRSFCAEISAGKNASLVGSLLPQVQNIINFIEISQREDLSSQLTYELEKRDKIRNQNHKEIFSEAQFL